MPRVVRAALVAQYNCPKKILHTRLFVADSWLAAAVAPNGEVY